MIRTDALSAAGLISAAVAGYPRLTPLITIILAGEWVSNKNLLR